MHIAHVNPAAQGVWSPVLIAYMKKRIERWTDLLVYIFKKWDLQAMWDEAGRRWYIDEVTGQPKNQYGPYPNKQTGIMQHGWPKNGPTEWKNAHGRTELTEMNTILNRYRPGWDQIEIVNGSMKVTKISPCQTEIRLHATHVRYPTRDGAALGSHGEESGRRLGSHASRRALGSHVSGRNRRTHTRAPTRVLAEEKLQWSESKTAREIETTDFFTGYFMPDECPVLEGLVSGLQVQLVHKVL
jgi:hypothetical protein